MKATGSALAFRPFQVTFLVHSQSVLVALVRRMTTKSRRLKTKLLAKRPRTWLHVHSDTISVAEHAGGRARAAERARRVAGLKSMWSTTDVLRAECLPWQTKRSDLADLVESQALAPVQERCLRAFARRTPSETLSDYMQSVPTFVSYSRI